MENLEEVREAILSLIENGSEKPKNDIFDEITEFFEEERKKFLLPEIKIKKEEEEEDKPQIEDKKLEEIFEGVSSPKTFNLFSDSSNDYL